MNHPAPSLPDGVSVVIPAYNEERRISATLRRIVEYARERLPAWEVIVVDDGSRDRTSEVARAAVGADEPLRVLRVEPNRGKGHAFKVGALASTYPYVLLSDADLSTPIEEVEKLWPYASPRTVVIGSRALQESRLEVRQPFYREMMGKTFNLVVQLLLLPGIHDSQCGFKLLGREVVDGVVRELVTDRFAFDVELLARAMRRGFEVREVAVRWRNDDRTRVHPIRDSASMLRDVFRLWWRLRKG